MAAPITPNAENVDGHIVTVATPYTSGGATTRITVDLSTYQPLIDIREAHPVMCMFSYSTTTDGTGTEGFYPALEMARGTDADSTGEWEVVDANTVAIYNTVDQSGTLFITYKAYGVQEA